MIDLSQSVSTWNAGLGNSVAFQVILAVSGTVGGVLLAYWLSYFVQRPKIRIVGFGSGRAAFSVRISNEPRGIRIIESSFFGWRIHGDKTVGPTIETSTAKGLLASLYDKGSKQLITHLFWELADQRISNEATLASRESATLLIFNRGSADHRYYIWRPNTDWSDAALPPVAEAQHSTSREFRIELQDEFGRKMLHFPIKMTLGPDGRLTSSCPVGSGTF